jgi:hypothetical protein
LVDEAGSLDSGGATGAHELSLLIGFFIQLLTEAASLRFLADSPGFGLMRIGSETIVSKPASPTSSSSAKATHSSCFTVMPETIMNYVFLYIAFTSEGCLLLE